MALTYRAGVDAAGIEYVPITAQANAPLALSFPLANDSAIAGGTLRAQVRAAPNTAGTPLLTMAAAVTGSTDRTWQSLIDDCTISASQLPSCQTVTDTVPYSVITLAASQADLTTLLNTTGSQNGFFWDLRQDTPVERILMAGEFNVVGGVTI